MSYKIYEKIDEAVRRYTLFSHRHYILIIVLTALVTALAGWQALQLRLESDFEAMLPENYQSVKDLRRYQREVSSTSILSVGLMTRDIDAAKRFADDLVRVLETGMKGKVDYCEYNIKDVRDFFKLNSFLFLEPREIREKYDTLKTYIGERKLEATGMLVDLDEEDEGEGGEGTKDGPPFDFDKVIKEYNERAARDYGTRSDGYYINEAEDLLSISIYPQPDYTGVKNARTLIAEVDRKIRKLDPKKYDPGITYGFAGPVQVSVDEYEAIRKDIVGTLAICIALIVAVLILYFLRIRQTILIAATLLAGITMTLGVTRLGIGYLNAQTAFLGSIIIGTGINYNIILLARYTEERREGRDVLGSLLASTAYTWRATFSASFTTAAAFAILGISENLSFRHFGFIASFGVLMIWLLTVVSLPAMISASERIIPMMKAGRRPFEIPFVPSAMADFILDHPGAILIAGACMALASAFFIARWLPDALEYDFRNLRNKMTFQSGTEALDHRIVEEVTHQSTSMVVAIAGNLNRADEFCRGVEKRNRDNPSRYATGECYTLNYFVPGRQAEKIEELRKINNLLSRNEKLLPDKFREQYLKYKPMLLAGPVGAADLPALLKKKFTNVKGKVGVLAMVKPVPGKDIWVYGNLQKFVGAVRDVPMKGGSFVSASGSPIILYDLIQTVAHDAPIDTALAILAVFLVIVLVTGRLKDGLSVIVTLIVAVGAMVGSAAIFGTKINFFNFVAIPTAFGTGADYGLNILIRYLSEDKSQGAREILRKSMVRTGGAVFLCSATTIIGYFSLMTSNNQALVSYGKLAIAGEFACLAAAEIILPALILKLKI